MRFTIVIPCLNEAETLPVCIAKAARGLRCADAEGDILVADNGSTDDSVELAMQSGAKVLPVSAKGYGSALMAGIEAASGEFIIMGDADDSYDFTEIPKFVEKLREGADLVQGCRLPRGGGTVKPGAMPFLHRWLGNPMFSLLVRTWFGAPIHDVYCGLRGFRKDFQQSLGQRCTGMEFATEMIIKASLRRARIEEVPITLHQDGRKTQKPHLRTFRDGWRTLRFFLICSPRWLFLIPGIALIALGLLAAGLALPGVRLGPATFDAHTLLFGSLAILLGYQAIFFAVMTKTFAVAEGLLPPDPNLGRLFQHATLERGILAGLFMASFGFCLLASEVFTWWQSGFGPMDYSRTMKWVIPGATLLTMGVQTVLFSFATSMMGINRK